MSVYLLAAIFFIFVALTMTLVKYARADTRQWTWLPLILVLWLIFLFLQAMADSNGRWEVDFSLNRNLQYVPLVLLSLLTTWGIWRRLGKFARFEKPAPVEELEHWRLVRPALLIGVVAAAGIIVIALFAYYESRNALRDVIAQENLALGRTVSNIATESGADESPDIMIRSMDVIWRRTDPGFSNSYLCVIGKDGRLLYHSSRPDMVGKDVSGVVVEKEKRLHVRDLVSKKSSWAGENVNFRGIPQIVGYHYVPELEGLVAVHVPAASVDDAFGATVFPWMLSMLLLGGVLFPVALALLYISAQQASRKAMGHLVQARASERRYRAFFDQDSIGVALVEPADLKILQCNERFADILGIPREELPGGSWSGLRSIVEGQERPVVTGAGESKTPLRAGEWELDVNTRTGQYRRIRCSVGFVDDERNGEKAVIFVHDITDSFLAKANQQKSLELINATPDLIVQFEETGRIIQLNEAARSKLLQRGGSAPESIWELMPQRAARMVREIGLVSAERFGHWTAEVELLDRNGEVFITSMVLVRHASIEASSEQRSWSFVARDMTSDRHARQALQQSEQRFRMLVEHAPEAVVILNFEEQRFLTVNPAAERLFKMSRQELLSVPLEKLSPPVQPDGRSTLEAQRYWLERCLAGETPVFEWHHWDRDGKIVPCEIRLLKLEFEGRLIVRGSLIDISERIAARTQQENYLSMLEQRVAERTSELQAANEDLEAYAHTVAHDLRAPLRAIYGFAQALREDFGEMFHGESVEYLGYIESAARQMDQLIMDLLEYAKVGKARPQKVATELDQIVAQVIERLAPAIRDKHADITIDSPLGSVFGRSSILGQVILNLLDNALKFVPSDRIPQVRIWSERHENLIRLWIEDNGLGIAKEHQGRIFKVFERLHGIETYPGTGVGLAIVRRAIEIMDGRFGVESELGVGSRFWVELHAAD